VQQRARRHGIPGIHGNPGWLGSLETIRLIGRERPWTVVPSARCMAVTRLVRTLPIGPSAAGLEGRPSREVRCGLPHGCHSRENRLIRLRTPLAFSRNSGSPRTAPADRHDHHAEFTLTPSRTCATVPSGSPKLLTSRQVFSVPRIPLGVATVSSRNSPMVCAREHWPAPLNFCGYACRRPPPHPHNSRPLLLRNTAPSTVCRSRTSRRDRSPSCSRSRSRRCRP
jgi:hypothetical protein